ncbi:MAG TPA: ATP-binding cassette domain-containing protein, partial [Actinomycetota bacterium]|nr:ATP-binding cassette domain-containing protein [Actinomycetota bacterium]
AVDRVSFRVLPGRVTGFLGPNGAGKSTTMRMILGLDAPSAGGATVNGRPYRELAAPLREVGALLDAGAVHGGRTARAHLRWLARSNRIPGSRADEVLELAGLGQAADRRAKELSLGMGQRLGIAAAMLGDPGVLLLDEPVNGLDTEGITWMRSLLRGLAAEGRTVLVSSHLMGEMELTADHLVVIGQGRLLADTSMRELIRRGSRPSTLVRSPHWERLRPRLAAMGARTEPEEDGRWRVVGPDAAAIGAVAVRHQLELHELSPRRASLEEVYLAMTGNGELRRR